MGNAIQSGFGIEGGIAAEHQGVAQDNAEQYKANVATQNAQAAAAAAQADSANTAMKGGIQQGHELASYAAGGVRTDTGSPLDAIAASASANKLDQLNIIHKGDVTSTNYMNQANQDLFAGAQDKAAGQNNMFMNFLSAGLTSYAGTPGGNGNVNGSGGDELSSDQADYEASSDGQDLYADSSGEMGGTAEAGAGEEMGGEAIASDDAAVLA